MGYITLLRSTACLHLCCCMHAYLHCQLKGHSHATPQFGCFWTNGQICSATSRLLVQEGIAEAFFAQLKKRAESIPIGDPSSPDTRLGPVVSESQYKKIMAFIEARLVFPLPVGL